ncbi:MAG: DNA/RNA non-specific endonuclease [Eubacterium sp.]|nr:DNA/RNA non-specific endonuclease [Eubacterium sp.]MBR7060296.1 DNA/RNA non-specific endonuclease [Eubacterium sp.]
MKKHLKISALILAVMLLFSACSIDFVGTSDERIQLDNIPEFNYEAFVEINNNIPDFEESELKAKSFETYGKLDSLGRCTTCKACIGRDLMPTEKRGAIGEVKPTGWHSDKYNNVDGKYLYNRCHLIGYQLTAENANERNLITGTRYLNVDGMLPFEDEVADYIKATGNHVLYEVTPVFKDAELVARGVHMQAKSVEDGGLGVSFNVYCFNAQPGIEIDYQTGDNKPSKEEYTFDDGSEKATYIINENSKKFHKPNCEAVDKMSEKNKKKYKGTRENLIRNGYEPCGMCNP